MVGFNFMKIKFFGVILSHSKATGLNSWQEVECDILANPQGAPSTDGLSFMGFWMELTLRGRKREGPVPGVTLL